MWDAIVEFFTGGSSVTDAADNLYDTGSFSDWMGSLFEAENVGTRDSIAAVADDTMVAGDAQSTASGLIKDVADTASKAEKLLDDDQGIGDRFAQWWKKLDPRERAEYIKLGGGALAGAAKGYFANQAVERQAELTGQMAYDTQAGKLRATQEMNKVPGSVPFKAKPGGFLANQMGQPVALPVNPMRPRTGLILGGMNG